MNVVKQIEEGLINGYDVSLKTQMFDTQTIRERAHAMFDDFRSPLINTPSKND